MELLNLVMMQLRLLSPYAIIYTNRDSFFISPYNEKAALRRLFFVIF